MTYNSIDMEFKYPKKHRSFNQNMIPVRLAELARQGVFFESKMV